MSDSLGESRKFQTLTIVDEYTRESPAIEMDIQPGKPIQNAFAESLHQRFHECLNEDCAEHLGALFHRLAGS